MARRKKRKQPITPAFDAVVGALRAAGLSDLAHRVRIGGAWSAAVGARIAGRTEPVRFSRGVLTVRAASSAWQNELTFLKADLIEKLNDELGDASGGPVRDLRFVAGSMTTKEPPPPPPTLPALDAREAEAIREASQAVPDPEVRALFTRLVTQDARRRRRP